uniref:Putative secreted peptide n=1 Tax=Anopheles braziliensis TaxID=58242 RepID=A0A2M3ZQM0_9DIPT
MACVIICASSMAATAGDSQPLDDNTSTHACTSRIALPRICSVSPCSSAPSCNRERCACSSKFVLMCGSLNFGAVPFGPVSLLGSRAARLRSMLSSWWRTIRSSYSAADEMISSRPRIFVLLLSDRLNSSIVV